MTAGEAREDDGGRRLRWSANPGRQHCIGFLACWMTGWKATSMGDWSRAPDSLRGPHRLRPAPHWASTITFAAAYPFIAESGLGHEGTYIGTDVFGSGAFSYDPWILYDKGIISGPSIVVIGTVGTG